MMSYQYSVVPRSRISLLAQVGRVIFWPRSKKYNKINPKPKPVLGAGILSTNYIYFNFGFVDPFLLSPSLLRPPCLFFFTYSSA